MIYMDRIGDGQPHVPIDAGACVPTRGGLTVVINSDGNYIWCFAKVKVVGEFIAKTDVAEWSTARDGRR